MLQHLSLLRSFHDYLFQSEISLLPNQLPDILSLYDYNVPMEEKLHLNVVPSLLGRGIMETLSLLGEEKMEFMENWNTGQLLIFLQ